MPKLLESRSTEASSVLLYGASGCGKTRLAGTLSKHYKLLYFDLENGGSTLVAEGNREFLNPDNIDYQPIFDTVDDPRAWTVIRDLFDLKDVTLCHTHGKTKCSVCKDKEGEETTYNLAKLPKDTIVIFDSGSQIDVSIRSMVYGTSKGAWKSNQKATFDQWNQIRGIWDIIGTKIQVASLIPLKVVMIFHEDEAKDGDSVFPALGTRSYANTFAKYFSTVVHMHSRNRKYGIDITAVDSKAVAKNRAGVGKIEMDELHLLLK